MDPELVPQLCPILHGSRLTLEPLIADHAAILFPLLADDELWHYTDDKRPASVEALRERYRRLESRRSRDGCQLWLNWAVAVPQCGIVGFVQATVSEELEEAQLAYVIARRFWSLGFGTEAVRELVRFLRDSVHVQNIAATVDARNVASLRLLKKLGFRVIAVNDQRNLQLALPARE